MRNSSIQTRRRDRKGSGAAPQESPGSRKRSGATRRKLTVAAITVNHRRVSYENVILRRAAYAAHVKVPSGRLRKTSNHIYDPRVAVRCLSRFGTLQELVRIISIVGKAGRLLRNRRAHGAGYVSKPPAEEISAQAATKVPGRSPRRNRRCRWCTVFQEEGQPTGRRQ